MSPGRRAKAAGLNQTLLSEPAAGSGVVPVNLAGSLFRRLPELSTTSDVVGVPSGIGNSTELPSVEEFLEDTAVRILLGQFPNPQTDNPMLVIKFHRTTHQAINVGDVPWDYLAVGAARHLGLAEISAQSFRPGVHAQNGVVL